MKEITQPIARKLINDLKGTGFHLRLWQKRKFMNHEDFIIVKLGDNGKFFSCLSIWVPQSEDKEIDERVKLYAEIV